MNVEQRVEEAFEELNQPEKFWCLEGANLIKETTDEEEAKRWLAKSQNHAVSSRTTNHDMQSFNWKHGELVFKDHNTTLKF